MAGVGHQRLEAAHAAPGLGGDAVGQQRELARVVEGDGGVVADDLGGAPAEHLFGALVEGADGAFHVGEDDGKAVGGAEHALEHLDAIELLGVALAQLVELLAELELRLDLAAHGGQALARDR